MQELVNTIGEIITHNLSAASATISPKTRFFEDLEMDSLMTEDLMAALVARLDIVLDPMEMVGIETVEQLAELLHWKLQNRQPV